MSQRIKTDEKEAAVVVDEKPSVEQDTLVSYLDTYRRQYQEMTETYKWMKEHLDLARRRDWENTIEALATVVKALEADFEPVTPPRNWASGTLTQYLAPIPEQVRAHIDTAKPIFGIGRILIYDPNVEHFQRPHNYDPMVVGFVNLAGTRLHFLIGLWNIATDLKFIEGSKIIDQTISAVENVLHIRRDGLPAAKEIVGYVDYRKRVSGEQWVEHKLPQWKKNYTGSLGGPTSWSAAIAKDIAAHFSKSF